MVRPKKGQEEESASQAAMRKEEFWAPKTRLGKRVASHELTDIDSLLDEGNIILEKGICEILIPEIESDLLLIGQAKGKFGGGKRRIFRQTQKKTKEGNKPRFAALAVVGNKNGVIGIGYGKSKETVPAREKAIRNAKCNLFKIRRGCGSWECGCGEPHSLPFTVEGKCGSAKIRLVSAPKGTGLRVDKEVAKLLTLAGVTDVWSKSYGQTRTKMNLVLAAEDALRHLMTTKLQEVHYKRLSVVERSVKKPSVETGTIEE